MLNKPPQVFYKIWTNYTVNEHTIYIMHYIFCILINKVIYIIHTIQTYNLPAAMQIVCLTYVCITLYFKNMDIFLLFAMNIFSWICIINLYFNFIKINRDFDCIVFFSKYILCNLFLLLFIYRKSMLQTMKKKIG